MPMELDQVLTEYAAAITSGNAEILVGAGISQGVGYPGWDELLEESRKKANVPSSIIDAPLVAEYIANELTRERFESLILAPFAVNRTPGPSHLLLGELANFGLQGVWTTNYDTLLEQAFPNAYRIIRDSDYAMARRRISSGRLTKLHGSIGYDHNGHLVWAERPTITRSDYESYQQQHPIVWAELQARFLTSSFLFLGFSFNDPNIEVLLRLSRSLNPRYSLAPHFAIMRRERDETGARLQQLRVTDLERSGIAVALIDEFTEIETFLRDLRRRVIPPALFVSGNGDKVWDTRSFEKVAEVIQDEAPLLTLISMGSTSSYYLGSAFAEVRRKAGAYNPESIRFYYRQHVNPVRHSNRSNLEAQETVSQPAKRPVPHPEDRTGTAVYTDYDRSVLLSSLLDRTTAFFSFGVGDNSSRSAVELSMARSRGIPSFVLEGAVCPNETGGHASRTRTITDGEFIRFRNWMRRIFANTPASLPSSSAPTV